MDDALRAELLLNTMRQARRYTQANPDWNFTIALNGLNNGVEVKVWDGPTVVYSNTDPEAWLTDMLDEALSVMEMNLGPLDPQSVVRRAGVCAVPRNEKLPVNVYKDYGTCRCGSVMGNPCVHPRTRQELSEPHPGRQKFSNAHNEARI